MGRTILGAVAGLVVAFFTIMLVELASHHAYPPPPGIDPNNTADMARLIGMLPFGALLMIVLASVIGAFYYLRIVYYMYFGQEKEVLDHDRSPVLGVMLVVSAAAMVAGVVNLFGIESMAAAAAAALVQ